MEGKFTIEFDGDDVLKVLNQLTDDNYIKQQVLLTALKKGGEVLQKQTVEAMKSKLGSTAVKKERHPKAMAEGVRLIVDKNYYDIIVSIMKDYRLKWFEVGTQDRFTKGKVIGSAMVAKGDGRRERKVRDNAKSYRGSIEGKHYFAQARSEAAGIDEAINASLDRSLNKLFKA